MEDRKISFENSKRMRQRREKVENVLFDKAVAMQENGMFRDHPIEKIMKQNRKILNKAVYDFAERSGRSIYDICLQFMPEYGEAKIRHDGDMVYFDQDLRFVLMPMEVEEGPGYWKSKYYRLREKMKELIDNREV